MAVGVGFMSFPMMKVQVRMHHTVMLVQVQVGPIPAKLVQEDSASQQDQHYRHGQFQERLHGRGHPPTQEDDSRACGEQGGGVPSPPHRPDLPRLESSQSSRPSHERCNRRQVIRLEGVAQSEQEPQQHRQRLTSHGRAVESDCRWTCREA